MVRKKKKESRAGKARLFIARQGLILVLVIAPCFVGWRLIDLYQTTTFNEVRDRGMRERHLGSWEMRVLEWMEGAKDWLADRAGDVLPPSSDVASNIRKVRFASGGFRKNVEGLKGYLMTAKILFILILGGYPAIWAIRFIVWARKETKEQGKG